MVKVMDETIDEERGNAEGVCPNKTRSSGGKERSDVRNGKERSDVRNGKERSDVRGGYESTRSHQQKRNFCLPKVPFLFIQAAGLA